jgi:hypothetical protein
MMPDGDTAAHLRKQVGGLFCTTRLMRRHALPASKVQQALKLLGNAVTGV